MPSKTGATTAETFDEGAAIDMTQGGAAGGGDEEVFDFSNVKGPEPVPAGRYAVKAKKATKGQSKNGNVKIDVQYQITEVLEGTGNPEVDDKLKNRVIFDTLTFTVNSAFRVKRHLAALGFPKDFKGNPTMIATEMEGREAIAEIVIDAGQVNPEDPDETYPDRNRVAKLLPIEAAVF